MVDVHIKNKQPTAASTRLIVSFLAGALAIVLAVAAASWKYAPLVGWDTAALVYAGWTWIVIRKMGATETKEYAVREDPGRALSDVLLLGASLASLVAVGVLIAQTGKTSGYVKVLEVLLGLFSVVVSWTVVQIIHTLKYARFYYDGTPGGINFNQSSHPRYMDFAYLAFTLGMTYQVSDTDIQTREIRAATLKHALLSYVFGTVIIASTINTIAGLGK